MGGTIAIMWREIKARRDLLWLASAVTVLVILLPYLPGLDGQTDREVWETASALFAIVLGYLLAIGLGATTFGTDLSENRLGFFFARPVNCVPVWVGRMLGTYLVVLACQLITLTPLFFVRREDFGVLIHYGRWGLVPMVAGPALVLLAAHAMSVMFRARTPWLILDLLGFVAAAVTVWVTLRPLVLWGTPESVRAVSATIVAAAIAALTLAGAAGVLFGRTALRRVHGALSLTLWISLGATWAGAAYYGLWVNGFGPLDLAEVELSEVDPTGSWAVVTGIAPSRFDIARRFLVSTTDHRSIVLPFPQISRDWKTGHPEFSQDGEVAAWFGDGLSDDPLSLWWVDLGADDPTPVETTITTREDSVLSLSANGSRVSILAARNLLSVYDIADERLISMARLPEQAVRWKCVFADPDTVRCTTLPLWGEERPVFQIVELEVGSKEVHLTGVIDLPEGVSWPSYAANSPSLLTERDCPGQDCRLQVRDPRTGALESEVQLPAWAEQAALLGDGRVVARATDRPNTQAIALENPETGEWIEHQFGDDSGLWFGGEALPGQLVAFNRNPDSEPWTKHRSLDVFDLESGETRQVLAGPIQGYRLHGLHDEFWRSSSPGASSQSVWRHFLDSRDALVRWDPENDEFVTIAGGAK